MTDAPFPIDRRTLLTSLGATLVWPIAPVLAQKRTALALEAVVDTIALRPGQPPTPFWRLTGGPDAGPLRFRRGETVDVTLTNRLPVPIALNWAGLDGDPAAEPFTGRPAIAPDASATSSITFRHAGTMLLDFRIFGDAAARPSTGRAVIVSETETIAVDRDEVLIFQDWRIKPDGSAVAPSLTASDAPTTFTVNNIGTTEITLSLNERLRLRFINSSQSIVIAIKIPNYDVRVMAIDGQPTEPFLARDGVVVVTPGSRIDTFIEAEKAPNAPSTIMLLDGREARPIGKLVTSEAKPARVTPLPRAMPLPSNGLPVQLDLKSALRINLPLGTADWVAPTALMPTTAPAFKVKRGRVVVLALTNRGAKPAAFYLHGHHFRLLDRLDDGWKPFWLDTLAIDAGQTQRVAFAAEFAGLYPIEAIETNSAAPRKVRSYLVE
ncbi:MAG: copper oxidase [Tardiphaga sp.]|nr:copper oxidase [Tardiphaga sp.]